jgi:hypothetical protein
MNLALNFGVNVSIICLHLGCWMEFVKDKKYGLCSM